MLSRRSKTIQKASVSGKLCSSAALFLVSGSGKPSGFGRGQNLLRRPRHRVPRPRAEDRLGDLPGQGNSSELASSWSSSSEQGLSWFPTGAPELIS